MLHQDEPQPLVIAKDEPDGSTGLARNQIGVLGIVFFVVAAAAPLTVVVALFPVIIGAGNGIGIAGAFVLVALVLTVFAVGYVAMSKHITNAGAFYAFITRGLGRPLGLGSASLAIFAYNAIQLGVIGGFGYYAAEFVSRHSGTNVPWWVFSFIAMGAALFLGVRQIHAGARVLAVLLTLETAIILILNVGILVNSPTPVSDYSFEPFAPSAVFAGAIGVALMFAHASFIGFEGTAIYGEEAKDPKRTVPRATYASVIFMGVFYAVTAFLIVNAVGVDDVAGLAETEGGNLVFAVSDSVLGRAGTEAFQLLVITSLFAAILTFHNNVARYLYSLGRQGVIWSRLGTTHPTRHSPAIACYVQIAMVAAVVAIFAILGWTPTPRCSPGGPVSAPRESSCCRPSPASPSSCSSAAPTSTNDRGTRSSRRSSASPVSCRSSGTPSREWTCCSVAVAGCRSPSPQCCSPRWPSASSVPTSSRPGHLDAMNC